MMLAPMDVVITGDDLVTLVIVAGIVICGVLLLQWVLSKF
jgi:hypothetical protein